MRVDWQGEEKLRGQFQWITKNGMGPYFGRGTPVGVYQQRQFEALEAIERALVSAGLSKSTEVRVRDGMVYAKGRREPLGSTRSFAR